MEAFHNYLTGLYQETNQDGGDFVFPDNILKSTYFVVKLPSEEEDQDDKG